MLERKTTKPDELQKLTLALRDFERRLKRRRPEHLKAKLQKLADELQEAQGRAGKAAAPPRHSSSNAKDARERRDANVPLAVTVTRS